MNFVNRQTALGDRVYAIPDGTQIPCEGDQDALDRLPGFYRWSYWGKKFTAICITPYHDESFFDTEAEAQAWLKMKIERKA